MAYIFQTLANKGSTAGVTQNFSKESISWFRQNAANIQSVNAQRMMTDKNNATKIVTPRDIGKMFMYFYDPKFKEVLPYYDKFPLIFLVNVDSQGFDGINLHYISPQLRARLMDSLYSLLNNTKYDNTTKLKISYQLLNNASKFKYFAPCYKRYLFSHVQSNFINVPVTNWDMAVMLPTERFAKANKSKVFKESLSTVG
jgi:hypothetical protein